MTSDDGFTLRPGPIRDRAGRTPRPFRSDALAAAQRAGGIGGARSRATGFGRGRAASLGATHRADRHARGAVVKARVVRQGPRKGGLALHLRYLRREGVTQDGAAGRMFDAHGDDVDPGAFAERCRDDRHHFRIIVSPDDAEQLADLRSYGRDLMRQAELDLGTRLDWIAVDHWNTGHPHLHILVRGRVDDGADLVISREYISHGLRARAGALVQLELGPRPEPEIAARLARQVDADRWTDLDRELFRRARDGRLDLRPAAGRGTDRQTQVRIARLRRLERLGLAAPDGVGRWRLAADAEVTLRRLGRESDIIARLHAALGAPAQAPDVAALGAEPFLGVGRLAARGLDDELVGSGYAVIEGLDGQVHHLAVRDLADTGDAPIGAIVEARRTSRGRLAVMVRSDLPLDRQVVARGATWLDHRLVGPGESGVARHGFGAEVRDALQARTERLIDQGLARRRAGRLVLARDLLTTLRAQEFGDTAAALGETIGLPHRPLAADAPFEGVFRRRVDLASGRFAAIEGALGFVLVPWRPELEAQRDKPILATLSPEGRLTWTAGRRLGVQI